MNRYCPDCGREMTLLGCRSPSCGQQLAARTFLADKELTSEAEAHKWQAAECEKLRAENVLLKSEAEEADHYFQGLKKDRDKDAAEIHILLRLLREAKYCIDPTSKSYKVGLLQRIDEALSTNLGEFSS